MSQEIPVITDPVELSQRLSVYREFNVQQTAREEITEVAIVRLGGSVVRFTNAAFPGHINGDVMARRIEREPQGRGAHFDVYDSLVETSPWIGVYNLSGENTVQSAVLPQDLARLYDEMYPEVSGQATEARRDFSKIALDRYPDSIQEGVMGPREALVIPQIQGAPYIIHNIVPVDPENPGEFIKLAAPNRPEDVQLFEALGYVPLDELVDSAFGDSAVATSDGPDFSYSPPTEPGEPVVLPTVPRGPWEPGGLYDERDAAPRRSRGGGLLD